MSIEQIVDGALNQARPYIEQYGLLAVGVGILSETLLFAGVFIPGFSILIAAGFLAAEGALNPLATLSIAWLGGVTGDQICYALGRILGERVLHRHGPIVDRLRLGLEREGPWILLWYHYVSPMRIVMPYLAGTLRYSRRKWIAFDSIGVLLWVGFAFSLGYLAHGPLKRYGDIGYIVIFSIIGIAVLLSIWRLARLFFRSGITEEQIEDELEEEEGQGPRGEGQGAGAGPKG